MNRQFLLIAFFLIGAASMIIMSFQYFTIPNSGILEGKAFKSALWYKAAFLVHIALGIVAILLGPFQLWKPLMEKRRTTHRLLGYIYSVAVLISSITGLVIAQFAMGGLVTQVGFSILALLWFTSLTLALNHIVQGRVQDHQFWMNINYALTFAAITQRTMLLLAFIPTWRFMPIYQLSAWLPWMINLSIVLLLARAKSMVAEAN